ncbi:MAG: hypothetical protein ACI9LX_001006 [Paraglaciecola sp.]|jgi:hypothetical protein
MKTSPVKQFKNKNVNLCWQVVLVLACMLYSLNSAASAPKIGVTLSPDQCVAVNQGSKCFVDVEITWHMPKPGDYCLFSSQQDSPLQCWPDSEQGKFKQEFVSDKNIIFYLKQKSVDTPLLTSELKIVWVYKKNSRSPSSWRMF